MKTISNKENGPLLEDLRRSFDMWDTEKLMLEGETLVGRNGRPLERKFLVKKVLIQKEIVAVMEVGISVFCDPEMIDTFLFKRREEKHEP
jgi:hypothetical protein